MNNHNDEIRAAINMFDMEKARQLLREELQRNPTAETYYLASLAALNEQQRHTFLQKAVELDPFHIEANAELSQPPELSNNQKPAPLFDPPTSETRLVQPITTTNPALSEASTKISVKEFLSKKPGTIIAINILILLSGLSHWGYSSLVEEPNELAAFFLVLFGIVEVYIAFVMFFSKKFYLKRSTYNWLRAIAFVEVLSIVGLPLIYLIIGVMNLILLHIKNVKEYLQNPPQSVTVEDHILIGEIATAISLYADEQNVPREEARKIVREMERNLKV